MLCASLVFPDFIETVLGKVNSIQFKMDLSSLSSPKYSPVLSLYLFGYLDFHMPVLADYN